MSLTLKAPKGCHLTSKILIAAAYSKVEITVEEVERDPKKGYPVDGPLSKTPVLVTPNGTLFESNAIARFVARQNGDPAKLVGAEAESWIDFITRDVGVPLNTWVWAVQGKITIEGAEKAASADSRKALAALDGRLKSSKYLAGDALTLADVVAVGTMVAAFRTVLDGKVTKPFKALTTWFKDVASQPQVFGVIGEVVLAGEKAPCNAPAAAAPAAEEGGDEDDFDPFADEDEEDLAREEEIQRIADEAKAAKIAKGKVLVEKSVVVIDVKPWSTETDLNDLEAKIRAIEMEGLEWKSAEKKPVAFGLMKLVIMCHIVDKIVSVDDLQEKIGEFEEEVQSTDIASFSKL